MSHVSHQIGSDTVTDFPHLGVVQNSGVGTGPGDDDARMEIFGLLCKSVVIDESSFSL